MLLFFCLIIFFFSPHSWERQIEPNAVLLVLKASIRHRSLRNEAMMNWHVEQDLDCGGGPIIESVEMVKPSNGNKAKDPSVPGLTLTSA